MAIPASKTPMKIPIHTPAEKELHYIEGNKLFHLILKPKKYMAGNLPEWAKDRRIPFNAKIIGIITVLPILLGGLLVHILPCCPKEYIGAGR